MSVECATTPKTGYCFSTSSKVMIIVAQEEEFLRGIRNVVGNGYSGNLRIALIPDWFLEKILK